MIRVFTVPYLTQYFYFRCILRVYVLVCVLCACIYVYVLVCVLCACIYVYVFVVAYYVAGSLRRLSKLSVSPTGENATVQRSLYHAGVLYYINRYTMTVSELSTSTSSTMIRTVAAHPVQLSPVL